MGWNAGAFGSMRFPDEAARDGWLETTVSHAGWDDWFNELEGAWQVDELVKKRLARIGKGHDPASYCLQQVKVDGLEVSLRWDDGEDGFRDNAGDFAALLRCAEGVGATGRFWFLGTAGAEGDFTYELSLNGAKPSTVTQLERKAVKAVYDTLKALRDGTQPSKLQGVASPELMKKVTRDADYARWTRDFLGG